MAKRGVRRKSQWLKATLVSLVIIATGYYSGDQLGKLGGGNTAAVGQTTSFDRILNFFKLTPGVQMTTPSGSPISLSSSFCLRDANNDSLIRISDSNEFYVATPADCVKNGGAPGEEPASVAADGSFNVSSENRTNETAAVTYTTETQKNSTLPQSSNTTNQNTSAPQSSILPGMITTGVKGNIGLLTPAVIRDIARDRVRAGVDKQTWRKEYQCTEFARDLEKTNPTKYTFTTIACTSTFTCDGKNGRPQRLVTTNRHAINDVHLSDGTLGYVEPQTGKEVDMDSNGDQKVDGKDSSLVNQSSGLANAVAGDLNPWSQKCNGPITLESVKCSVENYEDTNEAYKKQGAKNFHPGFNPN